jgi:hypothetical protein
VAQNPSTALSAAALSAFDPRRTFHSHADGIVKGVDDDVLDIVGELAGRDVDRAGIPTAVLIVG